MSLILDCDTCQFSETVDKKEYAYTKAKIHENEQPNHFVKIEEL